MRFHNMHPGSFSGRMAMGDFRQDLRLFDPGGVTKGGNNGGRLPQIPQTGGNMPAQPFNGFPMHTGGNHPPLGIPMPQTGGPLPASPNLGQPMTGVHQFPMGRSASVFGQGRPAGFPMGGLARMYFGGWR